MAEASLRPVEKMALKRKCKFNEIGGAWTAKLPDNGIAQCNLCATDFSISSGGRTDVRRHQESARHDKLAKSKGSTKGGMVQYLASLRFRVNAATERR